MHVHHLVAGHDERPLGERVRADGRDHGAVERGVDDGSARGERVGGGAGGRGEDHPVRLVGGHAPPSMLVSWSAMRASAPLLMTTSLRTSSSTHHLALADAAGRRASSARRTWPARRAPRPAGRTAPPRGISVMKPKRPEVDAQDGHRPPREQPRGVDQGAVAAEHDAQLRPAGPAPVLGRRPASSVSCQRAGLRRARSSCG